MTPTGLRSITARHNRSNSDCGSILVLVMVLLVLMVLLGASYVQIARVDRYATRQIRTDNIDIIKDAVISQISQVLLDDIVDDDGNFFNGAGNGVDDVDEPYDYHWTDQSVDWPVTLRDGSPATAKGNQFDDTWLASAYMTFPGGTPDGTPQWPKLTNLTGIRLDLPLSGAAFNYPGDGGNGEHALDFSSIRTGDKDVPSGSAGLGFTVGNIMLSADADGDGILDSYWTWAPIAQIGGVSYVMAVRIIDLSSMINLNAATALTSNGDNGFASPPHTPRGYFPTSIDLSRFLQRFRPANWAGVSTQIGNLLYFRKVSVNQPFSVTTFGLTDLANYPHPGSYTTPGTGRVGAWLDRVSMYGDMTNKLAIADELELRHAGGLNNLDVDTDAENGMPGILRSGATELDWTQIARITYERDYFQGGTGPIADRTFPAVRHWLTTRSGSAVFAPNHADIHGGQRTLKYDLVYEDGGADGATPGTRITHIKDRIEAAFQVGPTKYLGLTDDADLEQVATEYALAIQDYSDSDHTPSSRTIGSVKYYGMELLPFLREVYIQAGYDDKDRDNDDFDNDPDTGTGDTWEFHADSQAMAVEIGNPFDRPIRINLLNNRIRVAVVQGGSDVSTHTLSGLSSELDTREKVVLYSNPSSAVTEGTRGADLNADLGLSGSPIDLGSGALTFNPGNTINDNVTVELRVDVDGTWVTYDRLTVTDFRLPPTEDHQSAPNPDTTAKAHGQGSMARDGQKIRYLSNRGKALVGDHVRQPDMSGYRRGPSAVDKFGEDDKGPSGDTDLDSFQIPIANRPIFSIAELGWILMFGFTDDSNGDFPQRFSGQGPLPPSLPNSPTKTYDPIRQFLRTRTELNLTSTELPRDAGIPHAAIVFDEFTTLSPRHDGIDNDNDDGNNDPNNGGQDNEAEQVVPATININTAPLHIMTLAAPLPEPISEVQALMEGVVDYRDNPTNRQDITGYSSGDPGDGLREAKGIASTAELLLVNPNWIAGGSNYELDMTRYAIDPAIVQQPAELDLYPMPEQNSPFQSGAFQYPHQMNAEGRMARFQFLAQAFTTRSDFYAAYVLILGYPATDFTKGPVESKRFYAIFDRSRIVDGKKDRVNVLAVRDVE